MTCLKGKIGENPTRSRHCKNLYFSNHCANGKGEICQMFESGDLPAIKR